MRIVVGCFFLWCFLQCCSAEYMNCTVTHYADQTIYNISEMSQVLHADSSSSVYTWANESGNVLANNHDKNPELVVSHSIKALITSKCFDEIVFSGHPHSEKRGYMAYCRINCTLNAPKQKEISHSWIAAGIAIAICLGLVLVLVGLCIKFKANISRKCSRDQLRYIYTSMAMQTFHPREANLEGNV